MKHTISVTVLLLCFVALMLPTYGDNALSQDWVPTTILLDENLSTSTANQILQTKDRYIWFATYDGLVRYDGTTFKTYNAYYEPSFDANSVRALFQDSKDRLWIGTNDSGLYYYMDGVFHGLERSDGFCYSMVLSIAEDQKGAIWVGGPDGLYQISITDHQTLQSDLVNNVALKDICVDCHNRIWAVTASGALKRLSESHEWLTPEELPEAQTQQIECIESVDGEIWIGGTDDRLLLCHSGQVWELMKGSDTFGLEAYTRIFADGSRYIWFCADNGIGCYDRIQNTFLDVNQGNIPIRHAVESVIQDHEGSLWISSSRSGIVKLSAGKFKNITTENGLTNEIVNAVLNVDRQLWVGTDHGLTIIENGAVVENELTALLEGERIRHMMRD
ncbi:MAG: hypothetical protein JXO44_06675, partial [Clostridia bacterium]|nr:hypothetical protein [Clostridia bacterium]